MFFLFPGKNRSGLVAKDIQFLRFLEKYYTFVNSQTEVF